MTLLGGTALDNALITPLHLSKDSRPARMGWSYTDLRLSTAHEGHDLVLPLAPVARPGVRLTIGFGEFREFVW